MALPDPNEFDFKGRRPNYSGQLKMAYQPVNILAPNGPNQPAPVHAPASPVNQPKIDPIVLFKKQLEAKKTPEEKAAFVKETLKDLQANPNMKKTGPGYLKDDISKEMSKQIITASLEATAGPKHGADRAAIIGELMQDKEHAGATLEVLKDDPKLGDLKGADLQKVPKATLEALPFNMLNVQGASFPAELDLSKNKFMDNANFDMAMAPLMTVPGNARNFSAKDAKMRQDGAANDKQIHNVAVLMKAGANIGTQNKLTNGVGTTLSMDQANMSAPGIDGVKAGLKPTVQKQAEQKQWAGISSNPSPFATGGV